jgi:hypothetical protein
VIGVFGVLELLAHRSAVSQPEHGRGGMIQTQTTALANPTGNLDAEQIRLSLNATADSREVRQHIAEDDARPEAAE